LKDDLTQKKKSKIGFFQIGHETKAPNYFLGYRVGIPHKKYRPASSGCRGFLQ
jgi:hypothetical protein